MSPPAQPGAPQESINRALKSPPTSPIVLPLDGPTDAVHIDLTSQPDDVRPHTAPSPAEVATRALPPFDAQRAIVEPFEARARMQEEFRESE